MSRADIKYEINKLLDQFSDEALQDFLTFLENLDGTQPASLLNEDSPEKI